MFLIKNIIAGQILTSKKTPTIEVVLETDNGNFRASVPAGVSTGIGEVVSLPAKKALSNIDKIIKSELIGKTFAGQKKFDDFLIKFDGSVDKSRLGANAILALSIGFYRASQDPTSSNPVKTRPRPMFNLIEGGKHSRNRLAIQEFLVCPNLGSFAENLAAGKKIQKILRAELCKNNKGLIFGDEGGFAPNFKNSEQALDILNEAIKKSGFSGKSGIGLDVAATSFYKNGKYDFEGKRLCGSELVEVYKNWLGKYPIISIEDPFAETDYVSWQEFYKGQTFDDLLKGRPLIVGDDLTCTNLKLMRKAKSKNLCNAVIIKPNQVGTVSETLAACQLAKELGWKIIVSHRAAETTDSFIADLAVVVGADFIKSGAPGPKERMAKYNRLKKLLITNF